MSNRPVLQRRNGYAKHCLPPVIGIILLLLLSQTFFAQTNLQGSTPQELPYTVYLPLIHSPGEPPQTISWDPRLDQRGATLVRAQVIPGTGYWQLVKAVWLDANESQGRHHILVDTLGTDGARRTAVPILVRWSDGATTVTTEAKPGETYSANFAMYSIAPSYSAQPDDGSPADRVEGMGLGEIADPTHGVHTSYGLTWRWTVAAATATPIQPVELTAVVTAPPPITSTPTLTTTAAPTTSAVTQTPSVTSTPTPKATASATPSLPATPTPTRTPAVTPTSPPTSTPQTQYLFSKARVVDCQPSNNGSSFAGYVKLAGQPVAGYSVVFSYEADGNWATQPAVTRDNPLGYYSHIISAGVARSGNWFAWIVGPNGQRISALASFTTDGFGGNCNVATVNFDSAP